MRFTSLAAAILAGSGPCSALSASPIRDGEEQNMSYVFANPPAHISAYKIPTPYESAVLGRRILGLGRLGHLATIFPHHDDDDGDDDGAGGIELRKRDNKPSAVAGMPYSLPEYVADCEDDDKGNPTLLAFNIAQSFKNAAGSNMSLSVQWTPRYPPKRRILVASGADGHDDAYDPMPYSAANLPRFSLVGYVERIEGSDDHSPGGTGEALTSCYVKAHPDARNWLPGSGVHVSHFSRLVVTHVYWFGGFGDRSYIGWIPVELWNNVTRKDWEAVELPGEKEGWEEGPL